MLLLFGGGGAASDRPGGHGGMGWDAGAHGEVGGEGRGKWVGGPVGIDCGWGWLFLSRQQVAPECLV